MTAAAAGGLAMAAPKSIHSNSGNVEGTPVVQEVALGAPRERTSSAPASRSTTPTRTVAVTLREYAIVLPAKLRPGRTTFVLHNRGRFPHNMTAIYVPTRFHSGDVPPGATERLTVILVPGAYLVACTVLAGGHLAQGMFTLFTIGSRPHGSATWPTHNCHQRERPFWGYSGCSHKPIDAS